MHLDSFTVLVATCVALVSLGFALLYFWHRERRSTWLLWWSIPFLIGGTAVVGYLRPNWDTDFAVLAIGNAVRITAIGFLWAGARVFEGRKPLLLPLFAVPVLWIGLCFVPAFLETMAARVVGVSLANAAFCGLAAWELWRGREEKLASRGMAIALLVSFATLMIFRILAVNVLPFPVGARPLDPAWVGGFNLVVFVHSFFFGLLVVALTKERYELEQRQHALVDPLTGLMNRRALMTHMQRTARRHRYGREQLSLLVLDIDHFKLVNDRFGHDTGDRVLVGFAAVAEQSVRPSDQVYRMGGEEFCIVLPDASVKDAIAVAERLRTAFEMMVIEVGRSEVSATVSIGIANAEHAGFDLEVLLAAADAAVYEAKSRGRNRVVVAEPTSIRRLPGGDPTPVERRRA